MKRSMLLISVCMLVFSFIQAQSNENVFTTKVGDYMISLLSEGQGKGNTRILVEATQEMIDKAMPDGSFPNATNAFLIKTPTQTILVDAGHGRLLFDNLQSLGVTPEQIDVVLLTHMHGDHIGGMVRDGKNAFPNAKVYISQPEYDYWAAKEGGAKNVIDAYESKLQLFQPEEEEGYATAILPGVYVFAAYGHTPGHTAYLIESKGEKMLIWGDLTHAMAIQMPYPQVAVTYDVNPEQAIAYRMKILKLVAANKWPIAGMHIAYPGMGMVVPAGTGYMFIPSE